MLKNLGKVFCFQSRVISFQAGRTWLPLHYFSTVDNKKPTSEKNKKKLAKDSKLQKNKSQEGQQEKPKFNIDISSMLKEKPPVSKWLWLERYDDFKEKVVPMANDLAKCSHFFKELAQTPIKADEFEKRYFKNYIFFISEILSELRSRKIKTEDIAQINDLYFSISKLYTSYGKLETSKLSLLRKKLGSKILESLDKLNAAQFTQFLESLNNFEIKSAVYNSKIAKVALNMIKAMSAEQFPLVLKYLTNMNFREEGIIEILTEKIYWNLAKYDIQTKLMIIYQLNYIKFLPNKKFLIELAQSLIKDIENYPDGELYYPYAPNLLSSLSELERRYTGGLIYLEELDPLYEKIVQSAKKNIQNYNALETMRIANGLQRAAFYDKDLLHGIVHNVLSNDFFGFSEVYNSENLKELQQQIKDLQKKTEEMSPSEKQENAHKGILLELRKKIALEKSIIREIRNNLMHLNNLSGILHALAIFNHKDEKFLDFTYQIIELYYLKFLHEGGNYTEFMDYKNIPKLIWSLCVLDKQSRIKKSCKYLVDILMRGKENYQMSLPEINQIYYSMIYLKDAFVYNMEATEYLKQVYISLVKDSLKTISMMHLDLSKALERMEIEHSIEQTIEKIAVDIVLEQKSFNQKKVVIDFHGYNHYFRNQENLKGNAYLKRKVLEYLHCEYIEISIFDWLLLDENGRTEYLRKVLSPYVNIPM